MNVIMFLYVFLLFVLLTPGILLSLPPKGGKWTTAIVHGIVFGLVWTFTNKFVWDLSILVMHPIPKVVVNV